MTAKEGDFRVWWRRLRGGELVSVAGPDVFSSFYFVVRQQWQDAIWLWVVAVHLVAVPLILELRFARVAED
ncbi:MULTISPECIES: hypothetical protein [unclassified Ensifer]|uniref:hypothetical protein n=1 Tax=unclassified Ensifer TaxID=2633371 RepID=UPI000714B327|nr:hypothetical protein [Ensifer sp. Root558]KQZ53337.1 hypothetical protein ASD63_29455 [Ensifer sp. Root558]